MILNLALKILTNRYVLLGIVIVTIVASAYVYYTRTNNKIQKLQNTNVQQEAIIQTQKRTIDALQQDYAHIIKLRDELMHQTLVTKQQLEAVRKKLYRENAQRSSLETLATKRTKLIEKKVNAATRKVWRELETITKMENK